MNIEFPAFEFK